MSLQTTAKRLEALGSPSRLEIFRLLVKAGREGLPVGAIQDRLGIAPSTLSHHLHRLIAVGLVTQERMGTQLICRADYEAMDETVGFLLSECCSDTRAK